LGTHGSAVGVGCSLRAEGSPSRNGSIIYFASSPHSIHLEDTHLFGSPCYSPSAARSRRQQNLKRILSLTSQVLRASPLHGFVFRELPFREGLHAPVGDGGRCRGSVGRERLPGLPPFAIVCRRSGAPEEAAGWIPGLAGFVTVYRPFPKRRGWDGGGRRVFALFKSTRRIIALFRVGL
jgi:hypothetical protein